jgi:threonine/homoserine/homoserine lactone efflux protein
VNNDQIEDCDEIQRFPKPYCQFFASLREVIQKMNLLPLFAVFGSSFAVAFSGAMMPGPLFSAAVAESSRRGFIAGPLLIVGHAVLEAALLVLLLVGFSSILSRNEAFVIISFLGGGILIWMAFSMFRSLPGLKMSFESIGKSHNRLILTGVVMSLSNPYWIFWWATIGLGICVRSKQFGFPGVSAFFIGHILADFLWYSAVTFAVSRGRKLFSDRFYRILVGSMAVLMTGFAIFFILSGLMRTGLWLR